MENTLSCAAYCASKTFHFEELKSFIFEHYRAALYRDTVHIGKDNGDIFIFSYGVIIFWNISHDRTQRLLDELAEFMEEPLINMLTDEFSFSTGEGNMRIHQDHIYLSSQEAIDKLSISHGIAQSLKLSELETYAQQTIESTNHIPHNIARTGKSSLKRKKLSMMRGKLFIVEMDINLTFELLDTPEFFWEYPEAEYLYERTIKYLDVRPRIEILNKKLNIIRELFNMLADEQNHRHSSVLEWIIIWLIAIEIALFVLKEFYSGQ
jgi:uncharacterized Rmd1/YagE family protein